MVRAYINIALIVDAYDVYTALVRIYSIALAGPMACNPGEAAFGTALW